jgi:putative endonuclease
VRETRVRAYRHGLLAEAVTALLFHLKGHRILARRHKTPVGEIDLVVLKGKRLAFVEAKQRRRFEDAGWALPTRAKRRIVRAA